MIQDGHTKVMCIKDSFHLVDNWGGEAMLIGTLPARHPAIGERLTVDYRSEDGLWVNFTQYDTEREYRWWMASHFVLISDEPESIKENEEYNHETL